MIRAGGRLGCLLAAALVASGCGGKYRNGRVWARDTFAETFSCEPGRVMPRELEMGWAVDGCGISATCDIVSGDWKCTRVDAPHLRAWKKLLTQTTCPKESVRTTRQTSETPAQTVVQLDACGSLFTCDVQVLGQVTCQPMNAVEDGAPVPISVPPSSPAATKAAGPPPPPPPLPPEECTPKCRSGYVCSAGSCVPGCNPPCGTAMLCVKGACVSACNPPCGKSEHCTEGGECVRGAPRAP